MATLAGMRLSMPAALWLAEHTYVMCNAGGKAWGCFGRKSGGTELSRAPGSTLRADRIAEPDERAGITCYLINGVCHQSANRILLPAGITVRGAKGYRISEARYGVYGRPKGGGVFSHCVAPFKQHSGVIGDIPECDSTPGLAAMQPQPPYRPAGGAAAEPEERYNEAVLALYGGQAATLGMTLQLDGEPLVEFMVAQFDLRLEYSTQQFGSTRGALRDIRAEIEREQLELEGAVGKGTLEHRDFPKMADDLTRGFQSRMLEKLGEVRYGALFEIADNQILGLADPDIADAEYG